MASGYRFWYLALKAAKLSSASSFFSCLKIPANSVLTSLRSRWGMALSTLRCLCTTQRCRGVAEKRAETAARSPSCPSVTIRSIWVAPRPRRSCKRQLLPKRRGCHLSSAPKQCGQLLVIHPVVFGMPLVVTMSVKGKLVAEFFIAALAFWGDMINFDLILLPEEKFTPSAFSLLFLEPFCPIKKVSVERACLAFYLNMALDRCRCMSSKDMHR